MEKFGKKVDVAQKAASLGVAGSEFNLGVGAGSGSVSGGVSAALPSFYHPKLSFMYEVPQSHSQLLEWIDLFFTWNPYIYSIITMHSHYVSSKFNFMGESVVTDFLNKNLFNQCGVYDVIKDAALSWWKYGEVFLVGDWDANNKKWTGFTILPPVSVEIVSIPFSNDYEVLYKIPAKTVQYVNMKIKEGKTEEINEKLLEAVKSKTKKLHFSTKQKENGAPADIVVLKNTTDFSAIRGSSIITPLIQTLVYMDYLRRSQMARVKRFAFPIEKWSYGNIEAGYLPTDEDLAKIEESLKACLANPPYQILNTPLLQYESLGSTTQLLNIFDDYSWIENMIFIGLGVNKNLVLGEGAWMSGTKTISLQRLLMEYQMVRDLIENKIIKNFMVDNLLEANGFQANAVDINWVTPLDIQQHDDIKASYQILYDKGLISKQTLLTKYDIDYKQEEQMINKEKSNSTTQLKDEAIELTLPNETEEFDVPDVPNI